MKTALYYTHDAKPEVFTDRVYARLREQTSRLGIRLISVTRRGRPNADVDVIRAVTNAGPRDMYERIASGLSRCHPDDVVYFCEDDDLYADAHFVEPITAHRDTIIYSLNFTFLTPRGFTDFGYGRRVLALSQAFGCAEYLTRCIAWKLEELAENKFSCFEPATGGPKPYRSLGRVNSVANVDIRLHNHTSKDLSKAETFTSERGWPAADAMIETYIKEQNENDSSERGNPVRL